MPGNEGFLPLAIEVPEHLLEEIARRAAALVDSRPASPYGTTYEAGQAYGVVSSGLATDPRATNTVIAPNRKLTHGLN